MSEERKMNKVQPNNSIKEWVRLSILARILEENRKKSEKSENNGLWIAEELDSGKLMIQKERILNEMRSITNEIEKTGIDFSILLREVQRSSSELSITSQSVFRDQEEHQGEQVFRSSYIPNLILHREKELRALVSSFKSKTTTPLTSSRKIVLFGPIGTGKSVISNIFGKNLSYYLKTQPNVDDPTFQYFHINCKKNSTLHSILITMLRQLNDEFPSHGYSVDELQRVFTLLLYEQNLVVLLILDEIDHLSREERKDILYPLSQLEESPFVKEEYGLESRLNLLIITRDKNFRFYLDSSTASHFQNFITFYLYKRNQLFDILVSRAELGLWTGTYDDELLDIIASLAEKNGNARLAIELLWRTAKIADREGDQKLRVIHAREAELYFDLVNLPAVLKSTIEDLSRDQKLLLLSIVRLLNKNNRSYVITPNVKTAYAKICEEVKVPSLRQTQVWAYLKDLSRLGLIRQVIEKQPHKSDSQKRISTIWLGDIPIEEVISSLEPFYIQVREEYKKQKNNRDL